MKQEYDELMKEIKKKIEEKNEIETKLKELTEVAGYSVDAIIKMCKEGYTFIPPKRKGY